MSATNSSCVDVTFSVAENLSIDWTLFSGRASSPWASGTTTDDTWTGCFSEPFACAQLTAQVSWSGDSQTSYSTYVHVVWNGVVWADEYLGLDPSNEVTVVWIGNECHKDYYQICNYNANTWLLDVELTTEVTDSLKIPVYWTVYSDFVHHGRSNIHQKDRFRYEGYRSNTTYRSLHCIEYNGGCNEFGISQQSAIASDPIIRVNGIVKTDRWNCTQGLCDGYTVTPLQGCSDSLSGGAIVGIVVAAVVGAAILYCAAARLIHRNRNECSSELSREQAQD